MVFRIGLLLGLLACCSCGVRRTMTVESDPPGALVYMNDQEMGRTPFTRDFTWYGDYDVRVEREGYQTLRTQTPVNAPWWQWVPIDFFAEFVPGRPTDRRHLMYTMAPASTQPAEPGELVQRARTMRGRLETGENAPMPTAPATTPSTSTSPTTRSEEK